MTVNEWESARLSLLDHASDKANTLVDISRIGGNWIKNYFILWVLTKYIDIYIEYTPQTEVAYDEGDGNINFLTVEDMLFIQEKINEILDTDINLDFYLTT